MAKKLPMKQKPSGYNIKDFKYKGKAATNQDDFGTTTGIADMIHVDQGGVENNNKYYHGGVLQSTTDNSWWVYFEWGKADSSSTSWNGNQFRTGSCNFQFIQCDSEKEARSNFKKKMQSKNIKRLTQKKVSGVEIWVSRVTSSGKEQDGYVVQSLANRIRGLPDAYTIVDSKSVIVSQPTDTQSKTSDLSKFSDQVIDLANALTGGTQNYTRSLSKSSGVVPTLDVIEQVRDTHLPAAMKLLKKVGTKTSGKAYQELIELSEYVSMLIPRPIPSGSDVQTRLNAILLHDSNILSIQNDLNAFEGALKTQSVSPQMQDNPDHLLNANLEWIEPESKLGQWIKTTFTKMTNNRHSYIRNVKILNMFKVTRPDRDQRFIESVQKVAKMRKNSKISDKARLQPSTRFDIDDYGKSAEQANIFLGIHGTRAVNIQPILRGNLRLPTQLKGVHITGAAFGHGIYFATDWKKSYGYTGHGRSYYGHGGSIANRGFFMFLSDVIMGVPYTPTGTGSWTKPPRGHDSVAAFPNYIRSLQNDEHIIFNPDYQRIRYLIEADIK